MRERDWRRAQNQRKIQKRIEIIKETRDEDHPLLKKPGCLKKYNLTCDCGMCSNKLINKLPNRRERYAAHKEIENQLSQGD